MKLYDGKTVRDAEQNAIHVMGIPSEYLIMNAAGHLAGAAAELAGENKTAIVFCGPGNNGACGIACAAFLLERSFKVRVLRVGARAKRTPESAEMERRLNERGGRLEDFDPHERCIGIDISESGVVVDAILGTGLRRELRGEFLSAVRAINTYGRDVVAADIATGVDADSGDIHGEAVCADLTVAFSKAKAGNIAVPGGTFCGKIRTADIGLPEELFRGWEPRAEHTFHNGPEAYANRGGQ